MMEGRPPEKVEKMIAAVSEAIATSLEAPIDTVRIVVNEMRADRYGVGGKTWSVVAEERAQLRE